MPVTRSGKIVGMITETNLFRIFLELMGARTKALRVTALVEEKPGQLAKVTKAIAEAGGNFLSFGMFSGPDASSRIITFKVEGLSKDVVTKALSSVVKKFWDIRTS